MDGKIGPMRDSRGELEEKMEVKKNMGDEVGGTSVAEEE